MNVITRILINIAGKATITINGALRKKNGYDKKIMDELEKACRWNENELKYLVFVSL